MRFRDFHRNDKLRIGLSFLSGTANNMVLPFMSIYFSGKLGDTSAGLVLRDKTFIIFTLASLLLVSVEFHLGNYVGVRLEREMVNMPFFPWNEQSWHIDGLKMLGFLRTENTVLVVVLSVLMGVMMRRFSDSKVLFIGYACYILGYSYLAYSNQPWLLLVSMFIATVGELMYVPIKQAYLGNIAPDHARSSYMALFGMVYKGAMLLGGFGVMLGGFITSWMMASLIALSGFVGMIMFYAILAQLEERKVKAEVSHKASSASVTA